MSREFEVLIPVRNPPEVLRQTIDSLLAQTDRSFSVLMSDNWSTTGTEWVREAETRLATAGISARAIRPPSELGRVEHWNWAHFESKAKWIKPLFCGDWLHQEAVARFRATIAAHPQARFVHCGYEFHEEGAPPDVVNQRCEARFRGPEEMHEAVLRWGHQFGPPNAVAFEREAFVAMGGFRPMLPICADSLLCCALASRYGTVGIPEVTSHFQLHGARFSMTVPGRPSALLREQLTYLGMVAYHAWTEKAPIPLVGFARSIGRTVRSFYRSRTGLRRTAQ